MPTTIRPFVRFIFPCERVRWSTRHRAYVILNLLHVIRIGPGTNLPIRYEELWLFTHFSGGQGVLHFHSELRYPETDELVFRSRPFQLDFGVDQRLKVHARAIKFSKVLFRRIGAHEARFVCDGIVIATIPLMLEEGT